MTDGMSRTVLLVGPGWLGAPAARALAARGDRVLVVQRSSTPAPDGCVGVTAAIEELADQPALLRQLPERIDALVLAVAPSRARGDDYAMYPTTARGAAQLVARLGARQLLQISSTGVYNRHDGAVVQEEMALTPGDTRVQALQEAEQIVQAQAGRDCTVTTLRPAGLYGPGRDPAPRFLQPHPAPGLWCNFSWRDDVVSAMLHVLDLPPTAHARVFNCTDHVPVRAGAIVHALTGVPAPDGDQDEVPTVSRSNQRVSSAALIASGWSPAVPDVFSGLRRLGHALPGREGHP